MAARIAQISDTHLSAARAYGVANLDRIIDHLNADPPDLVVHTGDIQLDDPDDDADRRFAWELLARVRAPLLALPGNHDVGDSGAEPWLGERVDGGRLAAWLEVWGADRFAVDLAGWRLVGIDALLVGSGLAAEDEQEGWLRRELATAEQVVLFLHKPICLEHPEVDDGPGASVELPGRRRLLAALAGAPVRLVCSGHLHAHRSGTWPDGRAWTWAPSTVFTGRDHGDGAVRHAGYLEHVLDGDRVTTRLVRPDGLQDVEAGPLLDAHGSLRFAPEHRWVV